MRNLIKLVWLMQSMTFGLAFRKRSMGSHNRLKILLALLVAAWIGCSDAGNSRPVTRSDQTRPTGREDRKSALVDPEPERIVVAEEETVPIAVNPPTGYPNRISVTNAVWFFQLAHGFSQGCTADGWDNEYGTIQTPWFDQRLPLVASYASNDWSLPFLYELRLGEQVYRRESRADPHLHWTPTARHVVAIHTEAGN